ATTSEAGQRRLTSSGGCPTMPSDVQLTRRPAPPSRPVISFHFAARTRAPNFFCNAFTRSSVRLITVTLPAPRDSNPNTTARAPPPAPSTIAFSRPRSQPGAELSRLPRNPSTSVLVERRTSPAYHRQLAAPTAVARSSGGTASLRYSASILCCLIQ